MTPALPILIASALLLVAVLASKLGARIGVPALLVFLVIGLLSGSEGPGGIPFSDPGVAMMVGYIALALILFDGGLQTDVDALSRPVITAAALLATVGVVMTALVLAAGAVWLLDATWAEGLLIGAILSSTDAAAVLSVMRARGIGVPERLRSLIELESASNDPTAVFLTATAIAVAQGLAPPVTAMPFLYLFRIAGGAAIGWCAGLLLVRLLRRIDLSHDGLYPALTLAVVGVAFGVTEAVTASGFMAVYIMGLALASRVFTHRASLIRFHAGVAWLMQITMFLILGLLAFPSELVAQARPALLMGVILAFVARPVTVFVVLAFSSFSWREKALVAWVGLRGAAPIILATLPLVAGVPGSERIFSIVFFAVLISVLVQGPTVGVAARLLGVAEPAAPAVSVPLEIDSAVAVGVELESLVVAPGSEADGARLLCVGGPGRPLVAMIRREGAVFVPTGSTTLRVGDELFVLGEPAGFEEMRVSVSESVAERVGRDDPTRACPPE